MLRFFHCVCFVAIFSIAQAQKNTQELIANPKMMLSYDEEKFKQVAKKIDLPDNIMMLKASELLKYKDKILQLNQYDYFKLADWENWISSEEKNFAHGKMNDAYWSFDLLKSDKAGVFTWFKVPLQANQSYEIHIKFRYLAETEKKNLPRLPFIQVMTSKKKSSKINQMTKIGKLYVSKSNRLAEIRRKKIIQEFRANYGGFYPDDFAEPEKISEWQEIKLKYTAKGGEQFLLIGYELSKKAMELLPQSLFCDIDEVSVKLLKNQTTRETEEE